MLELIILLAFIGALAGLAAGLFGVGGGIILVPAFIYVFEYLGYDHVQLTQIAVATSLATIISTSARSLYAHNKKNAVDWDILRAWAAPIAIGAVLAVLFARGLNSDGLLIIFAIMALIIALVMGFGVGRVQIADAMPTGTPRALMGFSTGFLSTLMGIGGGSIAVPIMVTHGRPIHRAVATAAGFGGLIAVPSVIAFLLATPDAVNRPPFSVGYVNIPAFLIVIVMTFFTAPMGAALAHRLDAAKLKRYFAIFIFLVALNMLRKALT